VVLLNVNADHWEHDMLWLLASIETQRLAPRGQAVIAVDLNGFNGLAVSRFSRIDRDMGGCRS
jgi:hypothetical protein